MESDVSKPLCTLVGAGPGVSMAVARQFGSAGYRVALGGSQCRRCFAVRE